MKKLYRFMLLAAMGSQGAPLSAQNFFQRADSMLTLNYRKGDIDTAYITRPATKWTVTARMNVSGAKIESEGIDQGQHFKAEMEANRKATLSVGVSYLGLSLSAALNPAKLMGKYRDFELNFNSYGRRFGFDVIYQNAQNFTGWHDHEGRERIVLPDGMLAVKTLNLNAFYVFNSRRFSYPAAFSQSYIQRRSAGSFLLTAVNQMESSYLNVKTQIVDVRRNIQATENALCRLMAITPQHIERKNWGSAALHHPDAQGDTGQRMFDTQFLKIGVPATMLEKRPDIRMANHAMEEAFYNTQTARAAFFPSITLTGTAGWTNSAGGAVIDPGKLLLSFVGQLTQPIFARGQLKANLKINQLTQEDLQKKYVQTVIDAGNQVNEALADCQAAREKYAYYHRQVEVLYDAYAGTHELMDNGKASYIEVLTAQESLLNAQLSEAANMYNGAKAVIALYIALGGGTK